MNMNVRKRLGTALLPLALLLAAGIPGFGKNSHPVTLTHDAVLAGTTLSAGKYVIHWQTHSPEATVQFVQHHKVVLSAGGRIERRDHAYEQDATVYDTAADGTMHLIEIRFAYSNKVLVFNQ
jgi:hypothetical protein